MYIGSVRFFKHLIITTLILLIIIPIFISIVLSIKIKHLKKEIPPILTKNDLIDIVTKDIEIDDITNMFLDRNFSIDDLISSFGYNGINLTDKIYKEHFNIENNELNYQISYPDLYVDAPQKFNYTENVVYLTFDDGPSENTKDILNILDKYNIKATFFVIGKETARGKQLLQEIVARGHSIGIHSYSHNYNQIYNSVDAYLEDFNNAFNYIYNSTGVKANIFRFPGGSINNYNSLIYKQIIAEMTRRGFVFYDWNVSGEDAKSNET